MINNSALEEEQGASEPLTAMIDVIFTLIAFMMLMINTPLASMEVSLPSTDATAQTITVKKESVTLSIINQDDNWYIDQQPMNSETLVDTLKQRKLAHPDLQVIVNSDKQVPMERMVQLFTLLQSVPLDVTQLALKETGR
ncbi:ExbD/TolR family protein [Vibrio porteresiae]|uniref:Biopolymer transporter ExbD n=1 Tax=Vibrio porteresiae DSM 19223 TaxID=1123496 RepID=A0ABZ0QI67_9VIBR|nr:biopolymer transporter ExbD [Vibrio porteresiae]WPC75151.1 biopolymer transporter ExbD [Vibrio porteresiae DSM 19223]